MKSCRMNVRFKFYITKIRFFANSNHSVDNTVAVESVYEIDAFPFWKVAIIEVNWKILKIQLVIKKIALC